MVYVGQIIKAVGVGLRTGYAARRMQVDRPSAVCDRILKAGRCEEVVCSQQIIAKHATAFAFAGQRLHPNKVIVVRAVIAAVFQVIPNAVNNLEQIVADCFEIRNGILFPAELDPPIAGFDFRMTPMDQIFLRIVICPGRGNKGNAISAVNRLKHKRIAHRVSRCARGSSFFAVILCALRAAHNRCACFCGKKSVARRVGKQRGDETKAFFRCELKRLYILNCVLERMHIEHMAVQV